MDKRVSHGGNDRIGTEREGLIFHKEDFFFLIGKNLKLKSKTKKYNENLDKVSLKLLRYMQYSIEFSLYI